MQPVDRPDLVEVVGDALSTYLLGLGLPPAMIRPYGAGQAVVAALSSAGVLMPPKSVTPEGEMPYARELTEAWMAHCGYEPEQIAVATGELDHRAYGCEFHEPDWQCTDENDEAHHPLHDAAYEADQWFMFALEHLTAAGVLMPADAKTRQEWRGRWWDEDEWLNSSPYDTREEAEARIAASAERGRTGGQLVRRTIVTWETTDGT